MGKQSRLDVYKRQGQAFLELHPTKYAEELVKKMEKSGAKAYLVNTCLLYTSRCV